MTSRVINLRGRGARGESEADILRRTGAFGVEPTDSDLEAELKKNAVALAAADEAKLAAEQAGDLVLPQNIFVATDLATATADGEAAVAVGTFFKAVGEAEGLAEVRVRTADGSTLLYTEITKSALSSNDDGKGAGMIGGAFRVVRLTDLGMSPSKSPEQNLAAFKFGVLLCRAGGRLWLPPADAPYYQDTSGGWQNAPNIDKRIEIVLDGDLKASHSSVQANPPYLLNITADGVAISGCGRIIGDGTIDDINHGTPETFPGLIRVAADDFTLDGVEIVDAPKVGVMLYQCYRARIGGRWTGGPKAYGGDNGTAYFGVYAAGGGDHRFSKPRFYPDADNGMFVQCIAFNASHNNIVECAYAKHPYEKLIYSNGNGNRDIGCTVEGNPGFIPGTNIQGTITDVVRYDGSNCKSENLQATNVAAGIQIRFGAQNEVINFKGLNCGQGAIAMHQSNLSKVKVRGCVATKGSALIGHLAGDGIRLAANAGSAELEVANNNITGFSVTDQIATIATWEPNTPYPNVAHIKPTSGNGRWYKKDGGGQITSGSTEPDWPTVPGQTVDDNGIIWTAVAYEGGQTDISVLGAGPGEDAITESMIVNNITSGGQYGIRTNYVTYSKIALNKCNASVYGLIEDNGSHNQWEFNDVTGTINVGVWNISPTSNYVNYRVGDYTPVIGDGLVVTGTPTLSGRWEQRGRSVRVTVQIQAGGILIPSTGSKKLCTTPFAAARAGVGTHWNFNLTTGGQTLVNPNEDGGMTMFASPVEATETLPDGPTTLIARVEYEVA